MPFSSHESPSSLGVSACFPSCSLPKEEATRTQHFQTVPLQGTVCQGHEALLQSSWPHKLLPFLSLRAVFEGSSPDDASLESSSRGRISPFVLPGSKVAFVSSASPSICKSPEVDANETPAFPDCSSSGLHLLGTGGSSSEYMAPQLIKPVNVKLNL